VAQFAGGVPAMCDGVTQGQPGMELSLFSRDVIAMATGVALAHNMFDSALCLGVCDKIVPGLLMGALAFGHLPVIFVPAGPMPSGMPNKEKARIRQLYAEGRVGRDALLESEAHSYHSAGTCTFYGTANSNQMLMEVMGLHMPGAAFVPPNTPLRDALTAAAAQRAARITALGAEYLPLARVVDEKAIVNAVVGLLATGGSTNHTMHLVAMARCAGISITWDDFSDLSAVVPLLTRIYPNGSADVNRFQMAGGMAFLIRELLGSGCLHADSTTVMGAGLRAYSAEPWLDDGRLSWRPAPAASGRQSVQRSRRPQIADRQSRQIGDQDFGNEGRTPCDRSAGGGIRGSRRGDHGVQRGALVARLRGGGAVSGTARQRHARTAQAHAVPGVVAKQRIPGGAGHGWPHVRRLRERAGSNPCNAGSVVRRRPGARARWRHHPA
jgi:phosphogluconate dehydratase